MSGWRDREQRVRANERTQRLKTAGAILAVVVAVAGIVAMAKAGLLGGAGLGEEERGPLFSVVDSEGKTFDLAATDGTARVLFFMTTSDWCQPCKIMTRGPLREIRATYGADVTILSIEMIPDERSDADLAAYKAQFGATWPHARDTEGIANAYEIKFLSIIVILDQEGFIKFTGSDPPADAMSRVIEEMGIRPRGA